MDLLALERESLLSHVETFILDHVKEHPGDIATMTAGHFKISRQAVWRYMRNLVSAGYLDAAGKTKGRTYSLRSFVNEFWLLEMSDVTDESRVWRQTVSPYLDNLKKNVRDICQHGFSEMLNNVIDHAESERAIINVEQTWEVIKIKIIDYGVGIFQKIQRELNLEDTRHVILELSKGKVTTDPTKHTGEGIFFTSRMFDAFSIISANYSFMHFMNGEGEGDWFFEHDSSTAPGTAVILEISPRSLRTVQEVFDRFAAPDKDYSFSRTHVPLKLARYGDENLVSRSQARRILARFERFQEVMLDFDGIDMIGQAFADEIFRVFRGEHPEIALYCLRTNSQVERMIHRAWDGADFSLQ